MSAESVTYITPAFEDKDTGVMLRHWTRADYYRAAELGLFSPEERLELVGGEVYRKMPQSPLHRAGIRATADALMSSLGTHFDVQQQLPLVLANDSEPEPDIVVVPGSWRDYIAHPTQADARLVVEVSDTTLYFDRSAKASQYAEAGIPDYWILNLNDRTLEVHRDPGKLPGAPNGFGYRSITIYLEDGIVTPLANLDVALHVADLLPPRPHDDLKPERTRKRRRQSGS
jgi:Uma2 family endonuclease